MFLSKKGILKRIIQGRVKTSLWLWAPRALQAVTLQHYGGHNDSRVSVIKV